MVIAEPVPEVASIPAAPPETFAPGSVVIATVQPLAAWMPIPLAELIGPVAVTLTLAQPVAIASIPSLPAPLTVIGPATIV